MKEILIAITDVMPKDANGNIINKKLHSDIINAVQQVKNINYDTVLPTVTFMQLCPKCNGQGTVSKPPYVAGDVHEWTSSATSFVCDVCNGTKIIPATCNGE